MWSQCAGSSFSLCSEATSSPAAGLCVASEHNKKLLPFKCCCLHTKPCPASRQGLHDKQPLLPSASCSRATEQSGCEGWPVFQEQQLAIAL